MKAERWTEEEVSYLKKHIETSTYAEIGKKLGRTKYGVTVKAQSIGLSGLIRSYKKSVQTLCWTCDRSGSFRRVRPCLWCSRLSPVPGWTAQETEMGYCVLACPEYLKGGEGNGKRDGL